MGIRGEADVGSLVAAATFPTYHLIYYSASWIPNWPSSGSVPCSPALSGAARCWPRRRGSWRPPEIDAACHVSSCCPNNRYAITQRCRRPSFHLPQIHTKIRCCRKLSAINQIDQIDQNIRMVAQQKAVKHDNSIFCTFWRAVISSISSEVSLSYFYGANSNKK